MSYKTFSANKIETYRVEEQYDIKVGDKETLEDWTCGLCFQLVFEPKVCNRCGNSYCSKCIQDCLNNCNYRYICPLKCGNSNFRDLNLKEKKYINKIKLRCKHNGCNQFIYYTDYKEHLEKCQFRIYHCDNNPCTKQGYYRQMEEHSKRCKYRIVRCKECNQKFKYIDAKTHIEQVCPQRKVNCPFCNLEMKMCDYLNKHKTDDANCLKKLIKEKNKKLNEYEAEIKRLKNLINERNITIGEYKTLADEQDKEIDKLKNTTKVLIRKNEDKRKTINELKEYFNNGFNKFDDDDNNINENLKINNEIRKKQNHNQYLNTETNFYKKNDIHGKNNFNYLTERKKYDNGMRRINSQANFGNYRTINTEYQ